eukprot:scaffold112987_cov28-Tisochrysis_lutea.AAC.2
MDSRLTKNKKERARNRHRFDRETIFYTAAMYASGHNRTARMARRLSARHLSSRPMVHGSGWHGARAAPGAKFEKC